MTTVQKWDKNLQLIGDVIEQWFILQRKWIYLEGIFVGGDIRTQLPKEAKKFDDIDFSFRRVSRKSHIFVPKQYFCFFFR